MHTGGVLLGTGHIGTHHALRLTGMYLDHEPDDLDVTISELLVSTSDSADPDLPPSVPEVLKLLRTRLIQDFLLALT